MNVVIEDLLGDPLLTLVPGSVVVTSSTGSTVTELSPDGFRVTIPSIPLGEAVIIRFRATVAATANPGQILPNTSGVGYNGTPGDPAVRPQDDDAIANLVVSGASVSGFVFHEQRPGPSLPIPGATLTLVGVGIGGQPVLRTTTTDATGLYLFANLTPGNYTIIESQPAGFISSRQETGTPFAQPSPVEDRLNLTIPAGNTAAGVNYNFWEVQPGSLAGNVYVDVDNSGTRDPGVDLPIPGTLIRLIGVDWNNQPVDQTIRTGLDGTYLFENLLPGEYDIVEFQPAGFLDNADNIGSLGGANPINDRFDGIPLGQAANGIDYDFGELLPASISGFVYVDKNNNGRKDRGERGISGARVRLTGTDDLGVPIQIDVRTNSQGAYSFQGLRPGTYTVREFQPTGFRDGKDTVGSVGGTMTNDLFDQINLPPGVAGVDYLFGERPVFSKRDFLA
jgi:hypothetical protein